MRALRLELFLRLYIANHQRGAAMYGTEARKNGINASPIGDRDHAGVDRFAKRIGRLESKIPLWRGACANEQHRKGDE